MVAGAWQVIPVWKLLCMLHLLSIHRPAMLQALAKDWAYKMNKDAQASGKDKHVYR